MISRRYDAFLSYSQRDHGTVTWLRRLLSDYWVPRRKRRRIFLDRLSMNAGVLDADLVAALLNSRFLIVCCSANARCSEWVDKEVEQFLQTHGDDEVLVCAVGSVNEVVFPHSIEALQRRRGNLRWPDLRGFPEAKPRSEQAGAVTEALSLLANLVGFPGKDELIDVIARARARRIRIATLAAALLFIATATLWVWLYHTTSGALYLARQRVLRSSATEVHDDPALSTTAHAFGILGWKRDIERLANTVKDHDFHGLVLAAGYAALPRPDCQLGELALKDIDRMSAILGPRPFLLLEKCCGGSWSKQARPDSLEGDAFLRWGLALSQTGFTDRARELLLRKDFPAPDRLPLSAAIAIGSGSEFVIAKNDLVDWAGNDDASSRLYVSIQEMQNLDLGGHLKDTGSRRLVEYAIQALGELHRDGFGNWNQQQELAAQAAGAADPRASDLLGPLPAFALKSPSEATGLAWRALALNRLGRNSESQTTFDQAETAAASFTPQTRTWSEWFDIATAAALAADWRRVLRAAESPGDEATRFALRRRVIELWAHRDQPQTRW